MMIRKTLGIMRNKTHLFNEIKNKNRPAHFGRTNNPGFAPLIDIKEDFYSNTLPPE